MTICLAKNAISCGGSSGMKPNALTMLSRSRSGVS